MKKGVVILCLLFLVCSSWIGAETIIIDNKSDDFSVNGSWSTGSSAGYHVTDYRFVLSSLTETTTATWSVEFDSPGTYEVSVWYVQGSDRATDAKFVVQHNSGRSTVNVDQTTNGSQWYSIGSFDFPATGGSVSVSDLSAVSGKAVIADAVRFVRSGATYGDLYQGMWIQTWVSGILSAAETDAMITRARQNNVNCIFPEVRKVGDAYYISATEPRASNIDPSYTDPLADIITKAHDTSGGKQYIEVHAWVVPYRVWKDSLGTPPAGHVLNEHPEWRGKQDNGLTTDSYGNHYLDPGVPEVQDYMVDVVTEIVQNYDVDGIHWDYFRYPENGDWGYNQTAIDRFNEQYGKSGSPSPSDPDFCDFRREQIKEMGRKAYAAVKAIDWDCKLSAATIQWGSCPADFTNSSAYASVFQDWVGFMNEGLLDVNVLMNYKREHNSGQAQDYRDWADFLAANKGGRQAVNGPGVYMNYVHNSITQILYGMDVPGMNGANLYVYQYTNNEGASDDDFWYTVKADCFDQRRSVPGASWLDSPTQGILRGDVFDDVGDPLEGATITLSGGVTGSVTSDGSGKFTFLKLDAGTGYTATISASGYPTKVETFNINAGQVTNLSAALPVEISVFTIE